MSPIAGGPLARGPQAGRVEIGAAIGNATNAGPATLHDGPAVFSAGHHDDRHFAVVSQKAFPCFGLRPSLSPPPPQPERTSGYQDAERNNL